MSEGPRGWWIWHLEAGYSPPPSTWDTTGYGRQAGGTHPTGMHSCDCCFQEVDYDDPNFLVVYDLESGAMFKKWKPEYDTTAVTISSHSNLVVSAHKNGSLIVWDLIGGSLK